VYLTTTVSVTCDKCLEVLLEIP